MKILIIIVVILSLILLCIFIKKLIFETKKRIIFDQYLNYSSVVEFLRALNHCVFTKEELYEIMVKTDELEERDEVVEDSEEEKDSEDE